MTAPGTAQKPLLLSATGGMVEIKMTTPKDLGGYSGGVTGYRVLSQIAGEEFVVAYDGTNNKATKIILNGLRFNTYYKFVSMGMSYVDYPDFAVGLKLPATPLIVKETMIPKSTTLSTTPKITLSPFEFGAHLLPKGATFEFWIRMMKRPNPDDSEYTFLHFEDATGNNQIVISFIYDTLEWKEYGVGAEKKTGKVHGPQLKVYGSRRTGNEPSGLSASPLYSTYDNHPINGNGFPLEEWIHVAVVSYQEIPVPTEYPNKRINVGHVYLNGVLSIDGSFPFLERTLYVKNWIGHEHVIFDELRIYNEVRPESGIRDLMTRRLQTQQRSLVPSLVACFSFDDGVEQIATGASRIRSVSSDVASEDSEIFLPKDDKGNKWLHEQNQDLSTEHSISFQRNMGITVSVRIKTLTATTPSITLEMVSPTGHPIPKVIQTFSCEDSSAVYLSGVGNQTGTQEPVFGTCRMEFQSDTTPCNKLKPNPDAWW